MSLTLYFHPLASFCWKVLIALYENGTSFTPHLVDLADQTSREDFKRLWPIAKFPVLREDVTGEIVPESSVIIEYLSAHHPGRIELVPANAKTAWQVRWRDSFYDCYVNEPMAKIVTDKLRPTGKNDSHGVEQAKELLRTSYDVIEKDMTAKTWAAGDAFTMADCAAAPALFYANKVVPFEGTHRHTAAYLDRLMRRESFVRVLKEAEPYFALFPG